VISAITTPRSDLFIRLVPLRLSGEVQEKIIILNGTTRKLTMIVAAEWLILGFYEYWD
jgi:hypothetical protein